MEIRKVSVDRLLPAKYNPRKDLQPGDPEFEKLKRSVAEFGYVEPIIWNQRTGIVVGGHQRLKVLQHLGYTEVDCVVLDIDEQKEKALNVALNKISGDWDMPLLTALLKDLDESGFDATLTGFDVSEMSDMFDDQSEIVEDEPPAVAPQEEAPISKPGDRWLLGDHVLYCGDSTKAEDAAALMAGAVADLCITDPPYNVAYEGSNGKTIQNDNMPEEQFVAFLTAAFQRMREVMKPGAPFYIWHAETEGGAAHYFVDDRTQATVIEDKRIDINKLKKDEMRQLLRDIFSDKVSTTILNEDKPARNDDHPTMKPLKLLARLVKNSSRQGDIVLDTFGGSGSTLITCQQLGRRCYTMELDPKYADVIIKRYMKFTGATQVEVIRDGQKIVVT